MVLRSLSFNAVVSSQSFWLTGLRLSEEENSLGSHTTKSKIKYSKCIINTKLNFFFSLLVTLSSQQNIRYTFTYKILPLQSYYHVESGAIDIVQ